MSQGLRRLAAIMFTDMVGYTALGQRNESLSLAMVDEQRKIVRSTLGRHNGREVKTIGDAFLVEFQSALDAVRCAYDIQRAIREFNISLPDEKKIHLRIGIHLGDVVESQGDISGDAVNIASRIEALAEDGGVCVTRQVFDQVQNKFDLPLTNLGPKPLKNTASPIEVYAMALPWSSRTEKVLETRADRTRIAVLPFSSLSPNADDEYFADGLTEELITKLSEVRGLRVIARTSVMNYKKKELSIASIGKELSVGSIIEGSVRKAGNRVRITAQLIDTQNEEHLWASTYDRELEDIFAIQSDVAQRVADSLRTGVLVTESKKDTDNTRAYTLYLRAQQLVYVSTLSSLRDAVSLLHQALEEDPGFSRAYAALAEAWNRMIVGGHEEFVTGARKVEENARRALDLGPERAEAHAAMARAHMLLDRFEEGRREAERAILINPNLVEAIVELGINHITFGRSNEAIAAFRKAFDLDPLHFPAGNHLILACWIAGRVDEAIELAERMRDLNPGNPLPYARLAECYAAKRDFGKALQMLELGAALNPREVWLHIDRGVIEALAGHRSEAEREIRYLAELNIESVKLYGELFISAALGDLDRAFAALTRQTEIQAWPYNISIHPLFADLRRDPRYAEFCRRVGIPS